MKLVKDRRDEASGWWNAVCLVSEFEGAPGKAENFLRKAQTQNKAQQLRVCQYLFLGVMRHYGLLNWLLKRTVSRKPRPLLGGILRVAGYEMIHAISIGESPAQCIHFTVGQAKKKMSKGESSLANAVLRKWVPMVEQAKTAADSESITALARFYSHPKWLVRRWVDTWGIKNARAVLDYNQSPAHVFLRCFREPNERASEQLEPVGVENFFKYYGSDWGPVRGLLERGEAIVQDPATRLALKALGLKPGEQVLDLCAAPGGKSLAMGERIGRQGRVYGIDQPREQTGYRYFQWEANVARALHKNVGIFEADILELDNAALERAQYPVLYDKVLLDAPCSNTGVLNRKPDARMRIKPDDVSTMADIQLDLLKKASAWVKPEGVLVYSTCSLETEENAGVVARFLKSPEGAGWKCIEQSESLPHRDGFDGAGVARLERY